ncbi:hypothetical protein A2U01_0061212, partial [Trifolium medium]|nr:hypothetical protein [Trifolium medium]
MPLTRSESENPKVGLLAFSGLGSVLCCFGAVSGSLLSKTAPLNWAFRNGFEL